MSVYVDDMVKSLRTSRWPYNEACHLFSDSVSELHEFAKLLGLKRCWFQNKSALPHYDLTRGMRFKAIEFGAMAVNRYKFVEILRRYRPRKAVKNDKH